MFNFSVSFENSKGHSSKYEINEWPYVIEACWYELTLLMRVSADESIVLLFDGTDPFRHTCIYTCIYNLHV